MTIKPITDAFAPLLLELLQAEQQAGQGYQQVGGSPSFNF